MSAETRGHTERFTVEPAGGWTECECPPSLCRHDEGMREYTAWTVWDNECDEHAFITVGSGIEVEYLRKRDARAVADRLARRETPS